jgi:hypothetical protein
VRNGVCKGLYSLGSYDAAAAVSAAQMQCWANSRGQSTLLLPAIQWLHVWQSSVYSANTLHDLCWISCCAMVHITDDALLDSNGSCIGEPNRTPHPD